MVEKEIIPNVDAVIEADLKCLNCGTPLDDRFCKHCGQDSKEFKKSIWKVFLQFFETFTDFDNKVWSSLGPLIFKPGFLTKEFLIGRRKSYLNPIQMYAFFSFLFILSIFYLPDFQNKDKSSTAHQIISILYDSVSTDEIGPIKIKIDKPNKFGDTYYTLKSYDSTQKSLPEDKRYGFLRNRLIRNSLAIYEKTSQKDERGLADLIDNFKGNFANLLVLLIPLFTLALKVIYIRRKIFYVEHLIFAIHLHCFGFLFMTFANIASIFIADNDIIDNIITLGILGYIFLAMKTIYRQGWLKTFLKLNLLGAAYVMLILCGFVINILISAILVDV